MLLTTAYVAPAHDGGGLGRMLVQGMARDLVGRGGIRAVEAFGDGGSRRAPAGCLLPADFLGGWASRPTARTRRTRGCGWSCARRVTWRDEVEAAMEKLVGAVDRSPDPAHRDLN